MHGTCTTDWEDSLDFAEEAGRAEKSARRWLVTGATAIVVVAILLIGALAMLIWAPIDPPPVPLPGNPGLLQPAEVYFPPAGGENDVPGIPE